MIITDSTERKCLSDLKAQRLEELGEIEVVLVSGSKSSNYAEWKEMIEEHHYLHSSKLFGQQRKYLVRSLRYGNIGALAFSSAAWRLQLRDERIGWDDERRERELSTVVCNSRFLILPEYGVKNLASHVMSKCLKRLAVDWGKAYQVRPVLVESFVDKERFSGSCYKASNWVLLGETKGRGCNDKYYENSLSRKYIFVYELEKGILGPAPLQEEEKKTVTLFAISAREVSPPEGEAALHWRLFTNIEIEGFEEACEKVEWYSIRFSIETFHRILKSGRKSEDRRLETLERLERCLSIDMITAWRLMYLTMLGRKTPEISSDLFFNENEIDVLKRIKYGSSYNPDLPVRRTQTGQSLSIKEAVGTIAILGGFVTGKNRVPGVEVMWRGIRRLEDYSNRVIVNEG